MASGQHGIHGQVVLWPVRLVDQTQAEHGLELEPVPIQHQNMTGNSVLAVVVNNLHVQHQHIVQVRIPYTGILYRLYYMYLLIAQVRQQIFPHDRQSIITPLRPCVILDGLWCLTPLSTIFKLYRGGVLS